MIIQNTKSIHSASLLLGRSRCSYLVLKNYSTEQGENPRSRSSRVLLKSSAILGVGTALFGGLVWYDDRVRKTVEENIPYSKDVFNAVFSTIERKSKQIKEIDINRLTNFYGKESRSNEPTGSNTEDGKLKLTSILDLTPKSSTKILPDIKSEVKGADSIEPIEVRKQIKIENEKDGKPSETILDNEFEVQIIESLKLATEKASVAKDAKLKTISALQKHSTLLKEAVDQGLPNHGDNVDWGKVENAASHVEEFSKQDLVAEAEARKSIDSLKTQINEWRLDPKKASTPALTNSVETVKKLTLRLDELNLLLEKERSQASVLSNYKELVNKGRQQLNVKDNSTAFSNISQNKDGKLDGSLSEQELNAQIVYANMRVDELEKKAEKSQSGESQKIFEALEKQRNIDEKLSKLHVDIELQKAKKDENQLIEEKRQQFYKEWETEVDVRLRNAALAHAEHLEKVIRTQKQLHDIENAQIVEEAVNIERNKFAKQIELALKRLNGIENALNSRTAQDLENRRAKIFWSVCQNLLDSLIGRNKSQHFIQLNEIKLINNLGEFDSFVQAICNCFPKEIKQDELNYVQTEEGLKKRFEKVYKLARRTAQIGENGGSPFEYFLSWLQSLFVLQIATAKYSKDDKIDVDKYEPYEILNRIKYFVKIGDLKNAVRLANLLKGESARTFHDWICDAQLHLEARFLSELLLSHAQVTLIRTTY
uniref:MICOS complex subunit MIC60 n=1 Tax=Meloidogyne incognita TaxID=6306 RepID=A0A914KIP9_MELIC